MIVQDLDIYRGDDTELVVAVTNAEGVPVDLAGATVECVFNDSTQTNPQYADIDVNGNVITVTFTHEMTKDLEWKSGLYDVQVKKDGKTITIARGKVKITRDVTP